MALFSRTTQPGIKFGTYTRAYPSTATYTNDLHFDFPSLAYLDSTGNGNSLFHFFIKYIELPNNKANFTY